MFLTAVLPCKTEVIQNQVKPAAMLDEQWLLMLMMLLFHQLNSERLTSSESPFHNLFLRFDLFTRLRLHEI